MLHTPPKSIQDLPNHQNRIITAVRCSTLRCSLFFSHEKYSKQKLNGRQNIYDMTFRFVPADKNSRVCWHVKSGMIWSSHLFGMHACLAAAWHDWRPRPKVALPNDAEQIDRDSSNDCASTSRHLGWLPNPPIYDSRSTKEKAREVGRSRSHSAQRRAPAVQRSAVTASHGMHFPRHGRHQVKETKPP